MKKGYNSFQPWWESHVNDWEEDDEIDFEEEYESIEEMERKTGLKLTICDSSEDGLTSDD